MVQENQQRPPPTSVTAAPVVSEETRALTAYRARLRAEGYSAEERATLIEGFTDGWRAHEGATP